MSVRKKERKTSSAQFLENALQIQIKTLQAITKIPKRYTYLLTVHITDAAANGHKMVKKGNSIYPTNQHEAQMRRDFFMNAYAEYQAELSQLFVAKEKFEMSTKGIDVSTWNGNIDFGKVKSSGIDFVIIRSGFGRLTSQKDNRFENYYAGAKKAGLKIGSYWYGYAHSVAEARIEAQACLACIKGKSFDLPIYYDMEESSQFSLGWNTCTAMAMAFCEEIEKGGFKAGVYANTNWFSNVLDKKAIAKKYSVWHAQWSSAAVTNCDVWQYSECGRVSGISGNVDMNICYKTFGAVSTPAKTTTTTAKKKTVATLVKEVLAGKWGNGDERKKKLTEAGYNYAEVQAAVNKQLAGTTTAKKKIEKGGKVKVKNPVIYGTTKKFAVYYDKYDVLEVSGDRVVIGIGKAVTAAVKASNLEAV